MLRFCDVFVAEKLFRRLFYVAPPVLWLACKVQFQPPRSSIDIEKISLRIVAMLQPMLRVVQVSRDATRVVHRGAFAEQMVGERDSWFAERLIGLLVQEPVE